MKLDRGDDLVGCYVASETNDPYYYDLWFCKCSVNEDYNMEYFWSILEPQRQWVYIGTYTLLYIFWLTDISYEAPWLELWMSTWKSYQLGCMSCVIKIRTWLNIHVIWTISTTAFNYHNIWKAWHKLYLPIGTPVHGYSEWTCSTIQLPSIPTYKQKEPTTQRKLLFRIGYGNEATQIMSLWRNGYANRIMKLWRNGYGNGELHTLQLWEEMATALLKDHRKSQMINDLFCCELVGNETTFEFYDNYDNSILRKAMARAMQKKNFCERYGDEDVTENK